MIYILLITIPIGIARALMSFNIPDYKPFNCQSCLSFWIAVAGCCAVDYNLIGMAFITYLLSDLILIYESK